LVEIMPDALTAALARHLAETGDTGAGLELGEFRLADSPAFGREVADTVALAHGLPGWDEFRRRFTLRDIQKPTKPSPELIEAEARAIESDPSKRPYVVALLTHKLGEIYQTKLSDYEAKRKERDHIEQNHENSDVGYIRFLCAALPQARSFFLIDFGRFPFPKKAASGILT